MEKEWITIAEAAKIINRSREHTYTIINRYNIERLPILGVYHVRRTDIEKLLMPEKK